MLRDDPGQLRAAADYLDHWRRGHAEEPDRWPLYGRLTRARYEAMQRRQAARKAAERERQAQDVKSWQLRLMAAGVRWALNNWKSLGGGKRGDALSRLRLAIRDLERQAAREEARLWLVDGPTSGQGST